MIYAAETAEIAAEVAEQCRQLVIAGFSPESYGGIVFDAPLSDADVAVSEAEERVAALRDYYRGREA